jgi:bifunctional DNA-binding transcriptional regulator/antitoxin component of YhaV-PrlF toxin-antitoxin module
VTIPQELREKLGFLPHCEVEFDTADTSIVIRKARTKTSRGQRLLEHMRSAPRPMRGMTTDQLMALTRGED